MSENRTGQEVLAPAESAAKGAQSLGAYERPDRGLVAADIVAIVLTGLWLLGVAIYFLFLRPSGQENTQSGLILSMLAIFLPIALIWIGSTVAKTAAIMRQEASRLQGAIDAMRNAYIQQSQMAPIGLKPDVEKKLSEITASLKQTESAIATFATSREARLPAQNTEQPALIQPGIAKGDSQPGLALGTPPEALAPALSVADFIGALNFPENENDAEGFRQLRRALADANSGKLVRASQDVLTLMSQDGIYMDDLRPDRSRPELWRKFAAGQRGTEISGIGGIHDRSGLALAAGRMRSDPIFRDAVHHFLRQFDKTFAKFAEQAKDDDIIRLSNTRTARAFMLLGRVAGTFD
ncbi:MAG: hypothetical protein AAF340_14245 [Pseudomonadota bacterium]